MCMTCRGGVSKEREGAFMDGFDSSIAYIEYAGAADAVSLAAGYDAIMIGNARCRERTHLLSIFDLDRTLTRRGTYSPFLLHCALRNAPWRLLFVPLVLMAMIGYKLKRIDRARLKTVMHRLMIGKSIARSRITALAQSFAARCVESGCYQEAFALIARERAEGRAVVMATAAHRFYAEAIAAHLGIDHVIATESRWDGDRLMAEIEGPNCYGMAKCDAINAFLVRHGIARAQVHARFYSDDVSDLPAFEWADQPTAVNPSARLAALAGTRDWPLWRWGKADASDAYRPVADQTTHLAAV